MKGRSYIALRFTTFVPRDGGERYSVDTGRVARTGRARRRKAGGRIGVLAPGAAGIGGPLGGRKGELVAPVRAGAQVQRSSFQRAARTSGSEEARLSHCALRHP